jgi:ABC-type uncharacterized transport system substrate-binding protein
MISAVASHAAELKVLVVMSYEEDNPWCKEIKEGIDSVLGQKADITYFYMNTKVNFKDGPEKGREAYELYQRLQPQGVITADDDAQAMFAVPFLKNKTTTPVMFNGVNADAKVYGFPASNISGVLERAHVRESIAFIKQLVQSINKIGFVVNDVPVGTALRDQVQAEKSNYLATVASFNLIKTTAELHAVGKTLNKTTDAIYVDSLEGITDEHKQPLTNKQVFDVFRQVYKKPIIGANRYHVEQGALCAVVKTGQEQGEVSAKQLIKAMLGTPVTEIPVTRNYLGRRIINVDTLEAFGIAPRPIVLRGATLVKTR